MYVETRNNKKSTGPCLDIARVSVGWGAEKVRGTEFSAFCPREKWCESQTEEKGGGGEEGRKRLQTNIWILQTTHLTFHV